MKAQVHGFMTCKQLRCDKRNDNALTTSLAYVTNAIFKRRNLTAKL